MVPTPAATLQLDTTWTGAAKIVLRTLVTWISLYLPQKRKTPPPTGWTKREIHLHKSTEKRRGGDPSQFHLRTISLNFLKKNTKAGRSRGRFAIWAENWKSDQRHSQSRMTQKDWQGKDVFIFIAVRIDVQDFLLKIGWMWRKSVRLIKNVISKSTLNLTFYQRSSKYCQLSLVFESRLIIQPGLSIYLNFPNQFLSRRGPAKVAGCWK